MSNIQQYITAFTVCKFLEEVANPDFSSNLTETLHTFSEECDLLGGDSELFIETAVRELVACRLYEEDGGGGGAVATGGPANVTAGISGLKPDDLGVPVEAQRRHTQRNSLFKRKKPNKFYMNQEQY